MEREEAKASAGESIMAANEDEQCEARAAERQAPKMHQQHVVENGEQAAGADDGVAASAADQLQDVLREGEDRFREMINALPEAIYTTDTEGRLTHFNPAAARFSGRTPKLGTDHWCVTWKLYWPDGTPMPHDECPMAVAMKEDRSIRGAEAIAERPDGKRLWFEAYPTPLHDADGTLTGGINMLVDITKRKETGEALRKSKERLRRALAIETVGVIFFALDGGGITDANDAFLEMSGYSREDLLGGPMRLDDLMPPEWMPRFRQAMEELEVTGHTTPYEKEYLRKDGSRWRGLFATRRVDENMGVKFVIDVTALAEAEEALRRLNETLEERIEKRTEQVRALASKLTRAEHEERRRISRVLHDDLQQRLYGIQLKATLIRRSVEAGEQAQLIEHVEEAYEWIDTAIDTTRRLTVNLSPPVLESDGLADALGWLVTQMKEMHDLTVDLHTEQAFHFSDKGMQVLLFQMVRELLFNVVKHAETDRVVVELQEEDHHLLIRVIDEGIGFDVEAAEARQEHEGGFGLFSVRERLGLFGGEMEIASAPGQGTQVTIRVSLASNAVAPEDS